MPSIIYINIQRDFFSQPNHADNQNFSDGLAPKIALISYFDDQSNFY